MQEELSSRSLGEAVWGWLESRNYWRLLVAAPAFVAAAGVGFFAVYHYGWRADRAVATCRETGRTALAAGQFQRAALAYQSMLRLDQAEDPDTLYRVARCFGELGRQPEAAAMMAVLAPEDRPGFVPAHLFVARAILEGGGASPRALGLAETHLRHVLQQEPRNVEAQEVLGRVYVQLRRWDDARRQLTEAVAARPDIALPLAMTLQELGDDAAARMWAERAVKHFSTRTEETIQDDPRARLAWANALRLLKQYPAAAAVLETGKQKSGDAPYAVPLAQLCAAWAAELRLDPAADPGARLLVLQRGLEAVGHDPALLRELATLLAVRGPDAEAARRAWVSLLAGGQQAPLLHLSLGTLAHQRGDTKQASVHWRAAHAAAPGLSALANNLASTLLDGPERKLPLALAILEPVLERYPDNPFYRDTRGQILLRQGKAEAALTDLEYALPRLPEKSGTHAALAEVYGRLGRAELAAEHERLAKAAPR